MVVLHLCVYALCVCSGKFQPNLGKRNIFLKKSALKCTDDKFLLFPLKELSFGGYISCGFGAGQTNMIRVESFVTERAVDFLLQPQNLWFSHFLTLWPLHLEQSSPRHQALC